MAEPTVKFEYPTSETVPLEVPSLSKTDVEARPELIVLLSLLLIVILVICYVAAEVILPIALAFVLKLLFQPAMRFPERLHLPRPIAALLLILAAFSGVVAVVTLLSGPASSWAERLPGGLTRLEERLRFLSEPIRSLQGFLHRFDSTGDGGGVAPGSSSAIITALLKGTQHIISGFLETLLILYFLLVSGDTFLRRLVEIVPSFKDKRQVVNLSQQIEDNVSAYLVTITIMNALVGVATGLATWACGLPDPLLWGGLAFLLNYIPIMGPAVALGLLIFAGVLTIDHPWFAALPAALYLIIHIIEGESVTPMMLARRFTLNPVLVIMALIFWFWMWGIPGAILAVPMLAITKIICDGIKPLNTIGHFLEG